MSVNIWLALSSIALDEFKDYRSDPAEYDGPMDKTTYKILSRMADTDNVQRMFKTVDALGKTYILFSLYLPGTAQVKNALDYLTTTWENHFFVLGAWLWDGRQAGTEWELYAEDVLYTEDVLDDEGEVIHEAGDVQYAAGTRTGGVTGTPIYPIHAQTYKFMPDLVVYDENGDEISRTPATSNADLRDINLLQGQDSRIFT